MSITNKQGTNEKEKVNDKKLIARGFVLIGTIIAGIGIWASIINSDPPASVQNQAGPSNTSSSQGQTKSGSGNVTSPTKPAVPKTAAPKQQTTAPRLRTRGS